MKFCFKYEEEGLILPMEFSELTEKILIKS